MYYCHYCTSNEELVAPVKSDNYFFSEKYGNSRNSSPPTYKNYGTLLPSPMASGNDVTFHF